MKNKALVLAVTVLVLLVAGYAFMHRKALAPIPESQTATTTADTTAAAEPTFSWRFQTKNSDDSLPPSTQVALFANGNAYDAGTYAGSCSEIAEENLLAGEVSGVLCWFAGGGDEIGVFRDEDNNYFLLHGTQDEGTAEGGGSRGDFKQIAQIK